MKLKVSILILLSFSVVTQGISQTDLTRTKVGKSISLKIPKDFIPIVNPEAASLGLSRLPLAEFSSPDRSARLVINKTLLYGGAGDLELFREFYLSKIYSLYHQVDMNRNEIRSIGNHDFIIFEFIGTVINVESPTRSSSASNYVYIGYTVEDDAMIIINFNALGKDRIRWDTLAHEIFNSLRIR